MAAVPLKYELDDLVTTPVMFTGLAVTDAGTGAIILSNEVAFFRNNFRLNTAADETGLSVTGFSFVKEVSRLTEFWGRAAYFKIQITDPTYQTGTIYAFGEVAGSPITADDINRLAATAPTFLEFQAGVMSLPYDATDAYTNMKQTIALSHAVGEIVTMEMNDAPVAWADSQSTDNPSNAEYFPGIPRHDADHDVASTQAPLVVTKFRAIKAKVGATENFSVASVVGSVITLANNATNDRFLAALVSAGMVNRYYTAGKIATWAAGGVDFASATRAYCVNDGTADFTITAVNAGARTINVTGSPASVATISCFVFRIAGEALKVRLRRLDGFALVAGGSDESDPLIAFMEMDRGQGHWHEVWAISTSGAGANGFTNEAKNVAAAVELKSAAFARTILANATDGTPRSGKSTEVKRLGVAIYTWARTLLATNWT